MLFKDFMIANRNALIPDMVWDNYGLNDVLLPVSNILRERALDLLSQNYGKFEVGDIIDEMKADVFTNFPLLMQSLSIAMSMTYASVRRDDIERETRTVTETGRNVNATTQADSSLRDTINNDTLTETAEVIGSVRNTGTIATAETSVRTDRDIVIGSNVSTTPMTGSKNVNLAHTMPEQAIGRTTGSFSRDTQGTPILNDSSVQSADEYYSTINQFQNTQTSNQTHDILNNITNNNTVTNNTLESATNNTTGTNVKAATGRDTVTASSTVNGTADITNTTSDIIERTLANKQYPFEISNFLERIDTVRSFKKWVDSFSWLCGVV